MKKIRDFTETKEYDQLIAVITEWKNYVGIKETLTPEQLAFCCKFVKEEYSHLTIQQIRQAIILSVKGKLNVDTKPYGVLSPLYIATILNAYDEWVSQNRKEQTAELPASDMTADEKRLMYLRAYQDAAKSDSPMTDFKDTMWNYLTQNGYVQSERDTDVFIISEARKALERKSEPGKPFAFTPVDELRMARHMIMISFFKENTLEL